VQYTDHRITVDQQSEYSIMESAVRTLMPKLLRYRKRIYHCYATTYMKTFTPFQPKINSTKS